MVPCYSALHMPAVPHHQEITGGKKEANQALQAAAQLTGLCCHLLPAAAIVAVQGALVLDAPAPLPQPVAPAQLPFCAAFSQCTCCNASHSSTIHRSMLAEMADPGITDACKAALQRHHCSVCDAQVIIPVANMRSGNAHAIDVCPCPLWGTSGHERFQASTQKAEHASLALCQRFALLPSASYA